MSPTLVYGTDRIVNVGSRTFATPPIQCSLIQAVTERQINAPSSRDQRGVALAQ